MNSEKKCSMNEIKFDKEKCIKCGLCLKDCILKCIESDKDNYPQFVHQNRCISCQHCFSICPRGAITFNNIDPCDVQIEENDYLFKLIQNRRSTRLYKNEQLPLETLEKLKSVLHYCPTGVNSHSLHFSIVETKSVMEYLKNKCNKRFLKILNNPILKPFFAKFEFYKKWFEDGEDIIFRNAPHMIVASSPQNAPCKKEDAIIALSYFELYANNLGVSTCWCGYGEICLKLFPDLSELLDIPKTHVPIYVMLFGKPAVQYHRPTKQTKYKISEIKNIKENIPFSISRFIQNLFN